MRSFLVLLLAAFLFGTWAVLDEPTKQERALADRAAPVIAQASGNLPPHTGPDLQAPARAYAFRAAGHGLVVFVTYGMTSNQERALVRAAARHALAEDAELQAVSLEFYEANAVRGKARFFARETVER